MNAALQSLIADPTVVPLRRPVMSSVLAFLMIGGSGAAAFVVLSTLLIWADTGIDAWIINALCYAGFIVPIYLMHRRFSFQSHASHWQALPRYVAVQAMSLTLATLFGYVLHGRLALPSPAAAVLVVALTSGVNYLVLRFWAFAFSHNTEEALA